VSVGRAVVEALVARGITRAFCVPGESYLGVLDAFIDQPAIDLVTCRHEAAAGFMAGAHARITGHPGVVLVTRGPGLTNASIAIHVAKQDSTPLIVIAGQVPTRSLGREAFQEVDHEALGLILGKSSFAIRDPGDTAAVMRAALMMAEGGRPGPVLISIPEDIANSSALLHDRDPAAPLETRAVAEADAHRAAELLRKGGQVVTIVGRAPAELRGTAALNELTALLDSPVFSAWRRLDVVDNRHPAYAGGIPWMPEDLRRTLVAADTLLVVGTRLDDMTSLRFQLPTASQALVQLVPEPEWIATQHVVPDVLVTGPQDDVLAKIVGYLKGMHADASSTGAAAVAHRAYIASGNAAGAPAVHAGAADLVKVVRQLRSSLPPDAVVTCDAGAFAGYLHRYFEWRQPGTFLGTSAGAMGYAAPAAIGAKLALPDRIVVAVAGDGGFAMTMSEVATAAARSLSGLVFVVLDNGVYGSIRAQQRSSYPGREIAIEQGRLDLRDVGRGLGVHAERVTNADAFGPALRNALAAKRPAILQVITDPDQINAWA
jgi:acetolactate synthase-1/2/3 large subunit